MSSLETRVEPIRGVENAVVVHLEGVLDQPTLNTFLAQLEGVRGDGTVRVLLDMQGISYANSTALGALVTQADTFRDAGGELALLSPQPKVDLVIDMLGLKSLFRVFDSLEEARAHLASAGARPAAAQAAPAPAPGGGHAPAFPIRAECIACKVVVEFPQAGHFRCPQCSTVYAVDAAGHLSVSKGEQGRQPIEISLTCHPASAGALQRFIAALPSWEGYTDGDRAQLERVIAEVCGAIRQKAYGGDDAGSVHVLVLNARGQLAIRIADHGEPLDPSLFPLASAYMTEFELRPHPARGNLLKMVKQAD